LLELSNIFKRVKIIESIKMYLLKIPFFFVIDIEFEISSLPGSRCLQ